MQTIEELKNFYSKTTPARYATARYRRNFPTNTSTAKVVNFSLKSPPVTVMASPKTLY